MPDQEPYIDLDDAEWKARAKFTRLSSEFNDHLIWVTGSLVNTYMQALCDFIVAKRKLVGDKPITFRPPEHIMDATRVANLDFRDQLLEQLQRIWSDGDIEVEIKSVVHQAGIVSVNVTVVLHSEVTSVA